MNINSHLPIYEQLKQYFKSEIVSGNLTPGQELPSRRSIAQEFKVNPNTVQRAFKELEEEHIITTDANVPSRVTEDIQIIDTLRHTLLQQAMIDFYQLIQQLNISPRTALEALNEFIQQKEEKQ